MTMPCVCLCAREYKYSGKTQSFPVSNFVYTGREIFLFRKIFILGYLIDWFMWITFFRCASKETVSRPVLRSRIGGVFVGSESAKRMQIRLRLYYLWNVENKKFILIIEDTHFLRISDPVCFEVLEFIVIRNPGKGWKIRRNSQHCKVRPNCDTVKSDRIRHTEKSDLIRNTEKSDRIRNTAKSDQIATL